MSGPGARAVRGLRRGRLVRERARFALDALRDRGRVGTYHLRHTGDVVLLRHNGVDDFVLDEVFGEHFYEPPPEVAAILSAANGGPRVLELGGHLGYFGLFMFDRHPGAQITAFEPDPDSAELLRNCIRRNEHDADWEVVEACAAVKDGLMRFAAGHGAQSHVVQDDAEATLEVRALDVFPYMGGVDLVKIDIEGSEWDLIADERFAVALPRSVVLEYHSYGCPQPNAKRAAVDRLREIGYEVRHTTPDANPETEPFWGGGVLWAWLAPPK